MIKWLILTSLTGSIVSLLIILFKNILIRRLGGNWYYYVCLLTLVLFVVPIQLPLKFNALHDMFVDLKGNYSEVHNNATALLERIDNAAYFDLTSDLVAETSSSVGSTLLTPTIIIMFVWILGFAFMLSWNIISYFKYKHKVIQCHPMDKVENLDVVVSNHVHSPMLIGFLKPTIVIPNITIKKEDYKLALQHELNHYKQGDAWIKLFAVVVNSLHWFNPFTYLAVANLNEACEYSCDEKITKKMKMDEKKYYSEMILTFISHSTPAFNSNLSRSKKQLFRRFDLIMRKQSRNKRYLGAIMVSVMIAVSVITTSVVFAEGSKSVVEYGGALKTYYNPDLSLERNVQSTLGTKTTTEKIQTRVVEAPFYIDINGWKVDLFNRTSPFYEISREWKPNSIDLKGITTKTLHIDGEIVTVAFSEESKAYENDHVIEKMIRNQIKFELNYNNEQAKYDHRAFVKELVARGVYFIQNVTEAKDFEFELKKNKNGDVIGVKPLTSYDKRDKVISIFNDKKRLKKDINGKQGTQVGKSFTIKPEEILAIDIKNTTDQMPTINWAIVNVTTGEPVERVPNAQSGYRYIYTPGGFSVNNTFKVVISGEENDSAEMEIFTYKGTK